MPDLLLELRSEEIPARMQRRAAGDLRKLVTDALVEAGLTYEGAQEYWTPRRLALDIRGLTARSADTREERKGPRTDAPAKAIEGFLRGAGLESIDQAKVASDSKKGDFYVAVIEKPGRPAEEIIAGAIPAIIRDFPWPKSMRWGRASAKPGALRWVRPLQSILCTFGPETEEPIVVDFEVDGIRSGNVTYGHRFHAPEPITVRRFDDYVEKLMRAKVVLDAERRKEMIATDARNLAFASGLDLVEDAALLEEVSGLVEWPVVLMGEFEESFLAIPPEVIRLTIKENQKCFVLRPLSPLAGEMSAQRTEGGGAADSWADGSLADESTSKRRGPPLSPSVTSPPQGGRAEARLANRFVLVSNIEAKDGGVEIARGNGKVVRARLSDALYFWQSDQADLPDLGDLAASAEKFGLDLAKPLDQRMAKLDHLGVTFHAKLRTQGERVERIRRLARELAPIVVRSLAAQGQRPPAGQAAPAQASAKRGAAVSEEEAVRLADRAAVLAKADLTTEAVGEFPELQGLMGRRYAELQGEHPEVSAAIEDHYKPLGPTDTVPRDPVTIAVALADKLDMLVGFWAIDEKPTGSKDPYALRRAALGVIRLLLENGVRLPIAKVTRTLATAIASSVSSEFSASFPEKVDQAEIREIRVYLDEVDERMAASSTIRMMQALVRIYNSKDGLLSFFHDRLKVYLRDQGARHDLIDAVLAAGPLSPLAGEMSPEVTEGGRAAGRWDRGSVADESTSKRRGPPLSAPSTSSGADISPARGENGGSDDLLAVTRRVQALGELLETEDGKNLSAGTKRAANILAAEEKKGTRIADAVDPGQFAMDEEKRLHEAVARVEAEARQAIAAEDYAGAMRALASLRGPIDSFFEKVLVNDENDSIRANRLALLARIRTATSEVADFSKIAG